MTKLIIGARESSFVGRDGRIVEGFFISCSSPVPEGKGKGVDAERYYITKAKLESWGIDILAAVGHLADVFTACHDGKLSVVGLSIKS